MQEVSVVQVFTEALRDTQTWFRNTLNKKLLKEHMEHVTFSFSWELQVHCLLKYELKGVLL